MKKILFPTDFSDTAENAFQYALDLARRLHARLTPMSVYHIPLSDAGRVPPEYIERMLEEKKQQTLNQLEALREEAEYLVDAPRVDYGLFIAQEIVDAAEENEYDLIVMGTKGRHDSVEKLLGSVTTHVMMNAYCPVIAVPEKAEYTGIEHIAYATDFTPKDGPAVDQLVQFADELEAKIHFVHVDTKATVGALGESIRLEEHPFPFTDFYVVNDPSIMEGLDHFVKEKEVDLVALFLPRRRLWERLFHSSFSKRMTFHTEVPVMAFQE